MSFFPGNLPPEIIDHVLDFICPECTPTTANSTPQTSLVHRHYNHYNHYNNKEKPLKIFHSLSLTSKYLNRLSTPRLYLRPDAENWWLLARTLIARPDLAELIKHLTIIEFYTNALEGCPWNTSFVKLGPEDSVGSEEVNEWYTARICRRRRRRRRRRPSRSHRADHHYNDNDDDDNDDDDPHHQQQQLHRYPPIKSSGDIYDEFGGNGLYSPRWTNAIVDILTALCPRIETLEATIRHDGAFTFCDGPSSLSRLRHVHLRQPDDAGGMYITDLRYLFEAAASSLETIHLTDAQWWDDEVDLSHVRLDNVKELTFTRANISYRTLQRFLELVPNLQRLRYGLGGQHDDPDQFTPREALNVVVGGGLVTSLKEFEIEIHDMWAQQADEEWWIEEEEEYVKKRFMEERGVDFVLHVEEDAGFAAGGAWGWGDPNAVCIDL